MMMILIKYNLHNHVFRLSGPLLPPFTTDNRRSTVIIYTGTDPSVEGTSGWENRRGRKNEIQKERRNKSV
jgi:hypothetical protein